MAVDEPPISEDEVEVEKWPQTAKPVALEAVKRLTASKIENAESPDYQQNKVVNTPYKIDGYPTAAVGGRIYTKDDSDKSPPRYIFHVILISKEGEIEPVYLSLNTELLLGDHATWEKAHRHPDDRKPGKD